MTLGRPHWSTHPPQGCPPRSRRQPPAVAVTAGETTAVDVETPTARPPAAMPVTLAED